MFKKKRKELMNKGVQVALNNYDKGTYETEVKNFNKLLLFTYCYIALFIDVLGSLVYFWAEVFSFKSFVATLAISIFFSYVIALIFYQAHRIEIKEND